MNQPCYNSIALARHQHNLDQQEAKEHWIAAAVDRLMDDAEWKEETAGVWNYEPTDEGFYLFSLERAKEQANREYQQHITALEQARIDGQEGL